MACMRGPHLVPGLKLGWAASKPMASGHESGEAMREQAQGIERHPLVPESQRSRFQVFMFPKRQRHGAKSGRRAH